MDAYRAELDGLLTLSDGLEIKIHVEITDPEGLADATAEDLMNVVNNYVDQLEQDNEAADIVGQLRKNIEQVVGA